MKLSEIREKLDAAIRDVRLEATTTEISVEGHQVPINLDEPPSLERLERLSDEIRQAEVSADLEGLGK